MRRQAGGERKGRGGLEVGFSAGSRSRADIPLTCLAVGAWPTIDVGAPLPVLVLWSGDDTSHAPLQCTVADIASVSWSAPSQDIPRSNVDAWADSEAAIGITFQRGYIGRRSTTVAG
jgi:hypothetical protein